jgi:hypothetical protein
VSVVPAVGPPSARAVVVVAERELAVVVADTERFLRLRGARIGLEPQAAEQVATAWGGVESDAVLTEADLRVLVAAARERLATPPK